jgi:hypothetical protein
MTERNSQDRLQTIASKATRNERVAWNRKRDKMKNIYAELKPIEDQILDLMSQKIPVYDKMSELRKMMVEDCVHPIDLLVEMDDHVLCKFCNKKIYIK